MFSIAFRGRLHCITDLCIKSKRSLLMGVIAINNCLIYNTSCKTKYLYSTKCKYYHNFTHNKEAIIESNFLDGSVVFVPISTIKQYLLKHDMVFAEGHTCISIGCPVCGIKDSSMYINKVTGFFICRKCLKSGNWNLLELFFSNPKHFLAELPVDQTMQYGKDCWESFDNSLLPIDSSVFNLPQFKSLKKLQFENLTKINIRMSNNDDTLYIPLKHGENVVGFKKIHSDLSEETFPEKSAKGILLVEKKKDRAVVVATVKDFLTLLAYPLDLDIICLPNGQQNLPQEILPLFENYEKLIFWFDNDVVSWGNVKMFAKKLSENRCCFIRPLDNQPSPYDSMLYGYDVEDIIKNAQQIAHSSIVTFANLREDVLAEICNADKVSGVKWERFPLLNSILKGHRRGELTILTGPTGSGKTTLMSEYSLDLAMSKVTTLWGSFEIRNQRLAKTMLTQMFMAPLEKNINKFNEWADQFERLPIYFMTFHGQQLLDTVMEAVEHATYVHDVAHVIIDNVQFMLGLSNSESGFLDRTFLPAILSEHLE